MHIIRITEHSSSASSVSRGKQAPEDKVPPPVEEGLRSHGAGEKMAEKLGYMRISVAESPQKVEEQKNIPVQDYTVEKP